MHEGLGNFDYVKLEGFESLRWTYLVGMQSLGWNDFSKRELVDSS